MSSIYNVALYVGTYVAGVSIVGGGNISAVGASEILAPPTPASGGGSVLRYGLTPAPDNLTVTFTAPVAISPNALVFRNGILLTSGDDYSFTGMSITFFTTPQFGDNLVLYQ